jgi:2-octaprenyl-6-methoxyphenol hydroxylase
VAALGYVIPARDLEDVVAQLIAQAGIEQICPARVIGIASDDNLAHISLKQHDSSLNISARLVVGADGGQSTVRKLLEIDQAVTEYQQAAIVTTITNALAAGQMPNAANMLTVPLASAKARSPAGELCNCSRVLAPDW